MPEMRRYTVTQVREVEVSSSESMADAIALAEKIFNPTAEDLIENKGRKIPEPRVTAINAVEVRRVPRAI